MTVETWAGWKLDHDRRVLTVYFFNHKNGKLIFIGRFTFDGAITERRARMEAMRFQMIENEILPQECAVMPLAEILPMMLYDAGS